MIAGCGRKSWPFDNGRGIALCRKLQSRFKNKMLLLFLFGFSEGGKKREGGGGTVHQFFKIR